MTTETIKPFKPNAVLITEDAIDKSPSGRVTIDPDECTLLYLDSEEREGPLYTKEAWLGDRRIAFTLRDEVYYRGDTESFFCRAGLSIRDQEPVEGARIQLLPDMWVLKRDETEYWEGLEELRIARVFGVYVLNKMKVTYLCEVTPSYTLHRMESQYDQGWSVDDPDYDRLNEAAHEHIRDGDRHDEDVTYVHCHDVERMLENRLDVHAGDLPNGTPHNNGGYCVGELRAVTEEEALEEIREWTCNGDL